MFQYYYYLFQENADILVFCLILQLCRKLQVTNPKVCHMANTLQAKICSQIYSHCLKVTVMAEKLKKLGSTQTIKVLIIRFQPNTPRQFSIVGQSQHLSELLLPWLRKNIGLQTLPRICICFLDIIY